MKHLDEFRSDIGRTEKQIKDILEAFIERNGDIASLNIDISKIYVTDKIGNISTLLEVNFKVKI